MMSLRSGYDLLLRGGRVMCPASGIDGPFRRRRSRCFCLAGKMAAQAIWLARPHYVAARISWTMPAI
jgi:hypothetical protein